MTSSRLATMLMTLIAVCGFATLVWRLSFRLLYTASQDPHVNSSK